MFDDVYDNGKSILGKVIWVKEYLCKNADNPEDIKEIINDLEDLDANAIVYINYDHPMGVVIQWWNYSDRKGL